MSITILKDSGWPDGFGFGIGATARHQECAAFWFIAGVLEGRFDNLEQAQCLAGRIVNRVCVARDDAAGNYVVLSHAA